MGSDEGRARSRHRRGLLRADRVDGRALRAPPEGEVSALSWLCLLLTVLLAIYLAIALLEPERFE